MYKKVTLCGNCKHFFVNPEEANEMYYQMQYERKQSPDSDGGLPDW